MCPVRFATRDGLRHPNDLPAGHRPPFGGDEVRVNYIGAVPPRRTAGESGYGKESKMRTRLRRPAIVAAFLLLFLHGTETTYASETAGVSLDLTLEATAFSEAVPEERLIAPEAATLPALMAIVDSGGGVKSSDLQAVSLLARTIFKAKRPNGARAAAKEMAKEKYGWGRYQFGCLDTLWTKESKWNFRARNSRTGAYGIPQALPAAKMAIRGEDWRTNPLTQISWGLHYIDVRYETPCKALRKFQRSRYY